MQLYVILHPTDVSPFDAVSHCINNVSRWFLKNRMLLNPNKTEAVLFRTCVKRKKVDMSAGIDVAGIKVAFSSTVKLLGFTRDEDLSLNRQATGIVRGCSYHRRALQHVWPLINLSAARMVAQGVLTSRLDYCNGLPYETSLTRVVCQATWSESSTELRRSLHWLPVEQRVDYKLAVIA